KSPTGSVPTVLATKGSAPRSGARAAGVHAAPRMVSAPSIRTVLATCLDKRGARPAVRLILIGLVHSISLGTRAAPPRACPRAGSSGGAADGAGAGARERNRPVRPH